MITTCNSKLHLTLNLTLTCNLSNAMYGRVEVRPPVTFTFITKTVNDIFIDIPRYCTEKNREEEYKKKKKRGRIEEKSMKERKREESCIRKTYRRIQIKN